jgi:predicted metalloprotease with PDZ domain
MNFKVFATSLLLHLFLLLLITPKKPQPPVKIKVSGKVSKLKIVPSFPGEGNSKCKDKYSGIGITTDTKVVDTVVKGSPAHNAGLKPGDYILFPDVSKIRGKPGTLLEITFVRQGHVSKIKVRRNWICQM